MNETAPRDISFDHGDHPEQIRAARALLRLEQAELAERAGASVVTVRRLESAQGRERVAPRILARVRTVLEQAGAEFIPDGVRRRRTERLDARVVYEDRARSACVAPPGCVAAS